MKKRTTGYTLTELLVIIAIIGILSPLVGAAFISIVKQYKLNMSKSEIQRNARSATEIINKTLRQATSNSIVITQMNADSLPCSMIIFTHVNGNVYRFYQSDDKLYMGISTDGINWNDRTLGEYLRSIGFMYPDFYDDKIVSVSVCFEKETYEGKTKTLQLSSEKIRIMN